MSKIRARIKHIISPDVHDLLSYEPKTYDDFGIFVQLLVTSLDGNSEEGEESFGVTICTPKYLLNNHSKEEILYGRHLLIVFEYNYDRIFKKLNNFVNSIEGYHWCEVAEKIARIGYWEFEDYKE